MLEEAERLFIRAEVGGAIDALCSRVDTHMVVSSVCDWLINDTLMSCEECETRSVIRTLLARLCDDVTVHHKAAQVSNMFFGKYSGAEVTSRAESLLRYESMRLVRSYPGRNESMSRLGKVYARNALDAFDLILHTSRRDLEVAERALQMARMETASITGSNQLSGGTNLKVKQ